MLELEGMLPYFQIKAIGFGPIIVQIWGLCVAVGVVAATWFGSRLAKKYFLVGSLIWDISLWAIIGGLVGARLFYVLFYNLGYFLNNWVEVFYVWQGGASSLGGFFGAGVAVYIFTKIKHFSWQDFLPYLDVGALSLWLGWGIGRIGCFLIHDHIGKLSGSFLAVKFAEGARFDLGLLESLLGWFLFFTFWVLFKKLIKIRWGLVAGASFAGYALVRFFLDFLRATDLSGMDPRYNGLTPMQWGLLALSLLTFGLTFVRIYRPKKNKNNGEVA